MRAVIIVLLQVVAYLGLMLSIIGGVLAGRNASFMMAMMGGQGPMGDPVTGMVIGGVAGLILGLAVFGSLLVLIDIRHQTKRTADILTDLSNRRPPVRSAEGAAPAQNPPSATEAAQTPPRDPEPAASA
jgi:hypothetical protein